MGCKLYTSKSISFTLKPQQRQLHFYTYSHVAKLETFIRTQLTSYSCKLSIAVTAAKFMNSYECQLAVAITMNFQNYIQATHLASLASLNLFQLCVIVYKIDSYLYVYTQLVKQLAIFQTTFLAMYYTDFNLVGMMQLQNNTHSIATSCGPNELKCM